MELYETGSQYEQLLRSKAERQKLPYGGGMELLPFCNMSCNMCYIHQNTGISYQELLSGKEWISIAEKARDAGVLYILLTGGEPLLHPDFQEIYLELQKMGFILSVNTNGTLMDEKWADFFREHPCRRVNVTLYGASNQTYEALCHNPRGYDQVCRALNLLKENGIYTRINMTLTKENRQDLQAMVAVCEQLKMPFVPATYLFPPMRKSGELDLFARSRMSPCEAAETRIEASFLRNPLADRREQARLFLENITGPVAVASYNEGFSCTAGRSGYWINWKGMLSPCGMIDTYEVDLKQRSFTDGWKEITTRVSETQVCDVCKTCRKKFFCQSCAAACLSENRNFVDPPLYLCEVTDAMIRILLTYLTQEEQEYYKKRLGDVSLC